MKFKLKYICPNLMKLLGKEVYSCRREVSPSKIELIQINEYSAKDFCAYRSHRHCRYSSDYIGDSSFYQATKNIAFNSTDRATGEFRQTEPVLRLVNNSYKIVPRVKRLK
jgi:hypothetical protein